MSLKDWAANGWLHEHKATPEEIADLFAVADRDLEDCERPGLSSDWRLNIAYNAALQLGVAALAAEGYRAARDSHHYRVIQSLALTIGTTAATVILFDAFRKKRNIGGYERAGVVSKQEADEMVAFARNLRSDTEAWIKQKHPKISPF